MSCPEPSGDALPATIPTPGGPALTPPALIFSITVTGILGNAIVGPAIPDILQDFGQPDSRAGLFVAALSFPGIVVAPVIGILADRFGRRTVLLPCLVTFGSAGLLGAAAPTFPLLVGSRLLQGFGAAGLINLAVVLIGDNWGGLDRARLLGRNAAILTLSLAVLPPIGGGLTALGGWRLAFMPYGLALVTAILLWRRLDQARPADPGSVGSQVRATVGNLRQLVVAATIGVGFVVFMLIFGLFLTTLPVHLGRELDLGAGARGLVIGVPAVTSMASALNLARLRHRFGIARLLSVAPLMFVIGFVLIGTTGSLAVVVVGALVYGLGEGLMIPVLQDIVVGSSPPETRAAITAVWVGSVRAGQTVGPLAAGAISGATSTATTFVWGAVLATALMVVMASIRLARRAQAAMA